MDLFDTSPSSSPRLGGYSYPKNDGQMSWLLGGSGTTKSSSSINSNTSSHGYNYGSSSEENNFRRFRQNSYEGNNLKGSLRKNSHDENLRGSPLRSSLRQTSYQENLKGSSLQKSYEENLRGSFSRQKSFNLQRQKELPARINSINEPLDILSQTVSSCTENICGLYGLEVWRYDKCSGKLVNMPITSEHDEEFGKRSSSSMLIRRVTQEADPDSPYYNSVARDAFERLTDSSRLDYMPPKLTTPGVGLAGTLWSEASTSNTLKGLRHGVHSLSTTVHHRIGLLQGVEPVLMEEEVSSDHVVWREVDTLAQDPLQPYDERLQLFAQAGFKLASAIPFDIRGSCGIVIYYANPHMDQKRLRCLTNSRLIQFASQFIGSSIAVQEPIKEAGEKKNRRPLDNWNRIKLKVLAIVRFQRPLLRKRRRRGRSNSASPDMRRVGSFHRGLQRVGSFVAIGMNREKSFKILREATTRMKEDITATVVDTKYIAKSRSMKWWAKVKGGDAGIPPAFNFVQCMWTFIGSITTHAILSRLNEYISTQTGGELFLIFAPLGALTTLQYNLTAAPASQPRNAILSQILSMCTVYALYQFPNLDTWHRAALAPAIVETLTAKLGIIHPPSGAAAIAFSSGHYKVEHMCIFLVAVCITIIIAVIINNLSDKRQYPTSWPILKEIRATCNSSLDVNVKYV